MKINDLVNDSLDTIRPSIKHMRYQELSNLQILSEDEEIEFKQLKFIIEAEIFSLTNKINELIKDIDG